MVFITRAFEYGGSFQGYRDELLLGIDPSRFHSISYAHAALTFLVVFFGALVTSYNSLVAKPPLQGAADVFGTAVIAMLAAIVVYYVNYWSMKANYARIAYFCRQQARSNPEKVITLNEDSFVKFVGQSPVGQAIMDGYKKEGSAPRDPIDVFDEIDADGDERVTAKQIHRGMNQESQRAVSRNDIRRALTESDFAIKECMRKKAIEEQQLRQQEERLQRMAQKGR